MPSNASTSSLITLEASGPSGFAKVTVTPCTALRRSSFSRIEVMPDLLGRSLRAGFASPEGPEPQASPRFASHRYRVSCCHLNVGEHAAFTAEPALCDGGVFRVQLDQDGVT